MTNPNEKVFKGVPYDQNSVMLGLTKREWFAGMALQGWCANKSRDGESKMYAVAAVAAADALIAELSKEVKA